MSPLQDIMNTPKFQMRKMQRQMIKERDYRDGLERELASKLALIAQKGTTFGSLFMDNSIVRLVDKGNGQNYNMLLLCRFFLKVMFNKLVLCQLLGKVNPVGNYIMNLCKACTNKSCSLQIKLCSIPFDFCRDPY